MMYNLQIIHEPKDVLDLLYIQPSGVTRCGAGYEKKPRTWLRH